MHRLLVEGEVLNSEIPNLPREAIRHLRVLRPKAGEQVELFDGHGGSRVYSWQMPTGEREGRLAAVSPLERLARHPATKITLFACVTKGSRWDWTLEKATELGVDRIVPVISDRTIVRIPAVERESKCGRWRKIIEDASRQSNARWLPELLQPMDFVQSLELVRQTNCLVGALTDPPSPPIFSALSELQASTEEKGWAVYVGPEGDFTADELAALISCAKPVSFGPTILRAETAAIFAVTLLVAKRDEK